MRFQKEYLGQTITYIYILYMYLYCIALTILKQKYTSQITLGQKVAVYYIWQKL